MAHDRLDTMMKEMVTYFSAMTFWFVKKPQVLNTKVSALLHVHDGIANSQTSKARHASLNYSSHKGQLVLMAMSRKDKRTADSEERNNVN